MDRKKSIIVCGPVIIENQKVLLIKEKKNDGITPWFFPGGKVEGNETYEETCIRETKEEVGLDITIIKQLPTLHDFGQNGQKITLIHFLAKTNGKVRTGKNVVEWSWFDINSLPNDCAINVYEIITKSPITRC